MIRTRRAWLVVVAVVAALVGGACRRKVEPGASAPPKSAGPEFPKVGRPCESRFAIAEPDGPNCNPNIGSGWRLYPQRDLRRQVGKSNRRPISPEEPRRAAVGTPFCVY